MGIRKSVEELRKRDELGKVIIKMKKKTALIAGVVLAGTLWVTAADFNGDGRADLLWNRDGKGYTIWLMGAGGKEGVVKLPAYTKGWSVVETEDYDGDGKSDILWRQGTGRYLIWTMSELGKKGVIPLGVNRAWTVAGHPELFQEITPAVLRGKTFYWSMREIEWYNGEKKEFITYAKATILSGEELYIHGTVYDLQHNKVDDQAGKIPYRLIDGKLVFESPAERATITLIKRNSDIWYAVASYDKGKYGVGVDISRGIQELYLKKPDNFPSDL